MISGNGKDQVKANKQWFFPFCNTAFRGTLSMFADLEVENRERLSVNGPVIYVCNHLANLDPPIVASVLPRHALFLAKRELFSNPLFDFLLKGWGAYPVSRYSADQRALRWVRAMLNIGRAVVMFPEGTRSRNLEGMKKGQVGTTWAASQTDATLIPIGLYGTDNLQNILKVLMPISTIRMSVGEPFRVERDVSDRAELQAATDEVMARIAMQLPEERRGIYSDIPSNFEFTNLVGAASSSGVPTPSAISSPTGGGAG